MESDRFVTDLDGPGDHRARGRGDGPEAVAAQIADAVESLTALWAIAAQEASLRLSPHQLRALRTLQAAPGLNLTSLADRLDIGLPTASRLCDRLAAAGLLERAPHPGTRREVQLRLTAHGRHVLREVAARRTRALTTALEAMQPAERAALRRGLRGFLTARRTALPRVDGTDATAGTHGMDATQDPEDTHGTEGTANLYGSHGMNGAEDTASLDGPGGPGGPGGADGGGVARGTDRSRGHQ